jgi:hypothetical protein
MGLNQDPWAGNSYETLDYCWNLWGAPYNNLYIYESGVGVSIGTYAVGDTLEIIYDGSKVKYYQNGTLKRTVAAARGLNFYLDSSFFDPGMTVSGIHFGPLTKVGATVGDDLTDSSGNTTSIIDTAHMILGSVGIVSEDQIVSDDATTVPQNTAVGLNLGAWTTPLNFSGGNVVCDLSVNVVWSGAAFANANNRAGTVGTYDGNMVQNYAKDYSDQVVSQGNNIYTLNIVDRFVYNSVNGIQYFFFYAWGHRQAQSGGHTITIQVSGPYGGINKMILYGTKR